MAVGIMTGLVIGKVIGVTAAAWLVARFTRASLDEGLGRADVVGLAMFGGLGFTVSLLIGELAFGPGKPPRGARQGGGADRSLVAALLASVVLRLRNGGYRRIHAAENVDADHNGIPDLNESDHDR